VRARGGGWERRCVPWPRAAASVQRSPPPPPPPTRRRSRRLPAPPAEFVDAHAAELVALALAALPPAAGAAVHRALARALRRCLAREPFVRELAAALARLGAGPPPPPAAALVLLRWSALVLAALDPEAGARAAARLIECQAGWLAAAPAGRWRAAAAAAGGALAARPALADAYLAVAAARASAPLARLLGERAPAAAAAPLLRQFVDGPLAARERASAAALACYAPALRAAPDEAVFGALVPALAKAARRAPEAALPAAAFALRAAARDLSAAAGELAPPLLALARHAKEPVRRAAVDAVRALAEGVRGGGALGAAVEAACAAVAGRGAKGRAKAPAERAALAGALEALAAAPAAGDEAAAAAAAAVDFLCAHYAEEATEEGKLALTRALGAWLPRCGGLPAAAAARLAAGLAEREAPRRAALRALARALGADGAAARAAAAPLVPALLTIAGEGVAKAAARPDGQLALLSAVRAAEADAGAADALRGAAALAPGSPLLAPAALAAAAAAPEDAAAAAELAGAALALAAPRLKPAAAADAAAAVTLGRLHRAPSTRAAAAAAASAAAAAGAAPALLAALRRWAAEPGAAAAVVGDPGDAEAHVSLADLHRRFYHALLACLPAPADGAAPSPEVVASALLLAHHPLVAPARRRAWGAARARLGAAGVAAALRSGAAEVAAALAAAATGGDGGERAAARGALRAAAAAAAPELAPPLLALLAPLLDRAEHDALAPRQLRIYATRAGRLSNEHTDGAMIPAELFEEMLAAPDGAAVAPPVFPPPAAPAAPPLGAASGAAKPAAGAAAPRPSMAAAAAAKGGRKPAARDPAVEARVRQLAAEAEARAAVVAIRERLAAGLDALAAFAAGDAAYTLAHLGELSAPALPLLTSPLVGDGAALRVARALAATLPGALGAAAGDVAAALRLAARAERPAAPRDALQRAAGAPAAAVALRALRRATEGGALLDTDAYAGVFLLLRAALAGPAPPELAEAALAVAELHAGVGGAAGAGAPPPTPSAFELMYAALEAVPALRPRVAATLKALCGRLASGDAAGLAAAAAGLAAGPAAVRWAALGALGAAPLAEGAPRAGDGTLCLLWMARSDPDVENAGAATTLWDAAGLALPADDAAFVPPLAALLASAHADVRAVAAGGLAAGAAARPAAVPAALAAATAAGAGGAAAPRAARLGAAAALAALAPALPPPAAAAALEFLLGAGLADPAPDVRAAMVAAGVAVVDAAGAGGAGALLPALEARLDRAAAGAAAAALSEAEYDGVRQGVVVLLGALAAHLDPAEPKVRSIVATLLEALATPSEPVQRAAAGRLGPLLKALAPGDAPFVAATVAALLDRALRGESYGARRGAAFGLAGAVKGLGLPALRAHAVMDSLKAGVADKASPEAREGALAAFECLSDALGRLFEPYVIQVLPLLLAAFGDAAPGVREAAAGAARVVMGQLSAQGVKLVLPALLAGVEDRQWRTKQGAITLLGAMAHCAPRQLSACLPQVVPRLGEVLADPHPKVAAAARLALEEVAGTVRNPEVAELVPPLLAALADPARKTRPALDALLATVFVHAVDAPSLALVAPVALAGLRDRAGGSKRRAARIVGNLAALVADAADLEPYAPALVPGLQAALVDPLPEVRSTAARALGQLSGGLGGGGAAGDLLPWLLDTLASEGSSVERSGAAQGIAELAAAGGPAAAAEALDTLMPEALARCGARSVAAREGALVLLRHLPRAAPDAFRAHLAAALPAVLRGLADEGEGVRDAALAAGRGLVDLYAATATPLLLPAVEAGAGSPNWRIRQSSVELLGALLFKVSGATGRVQQDVGDEEGEGISVEAHGAAIVAALGLERRNEVLARLYLARSDAAQGVRTAALHVWKTLVTNTPRALGEALPALMRLAVAALAAPEAERAEVGGRCVGELVRKMGDRVLPQVVPILAAGAAAADAATRRGACAGVAEVLTAASREQLAEHLGALLPAVQGALCDGDAEVRAAAGAALGVLFRGGGGPGGGGGGAVADAVVPQLLAGLEAPEPARAAEALDGLRVVLGVRPQLLAAMLARLAPRTGAAPLSAAAARALGALFEAAGPGAAGQLPAVVFPLLAAANKHPDASPAAAAAHAALAQVAACVPEDSLHVYVSECLRSLDDARRVRGAAAALGALCRVSRLDFQEYVPQLLSGLLPLLGEDDEATAGAARAAVAAAAASVPKEAAPAHVRVVREGVAAARDRAARRAAAAGAPPPGAGAPLAATVPGLAAPGALAPLLPVFLQGVLQGSSAELREAAALGLGELAEAAGADTLRAHVVAVTGPLIRIAGDRFPATTKAAILWALGVVAARAGPALRPFVPQLQTTFVKALADAAAPVRARAAANLGALAAAAPRVDQLATDLSASMGGAEPASRGSYAAALGGVLASAGGRLAPEALARVGAALRAAAAAPDGDAAARAAVAGALGAYAARCDAEELAALLSGPYGPLAPAPSLAGALLAAATAERAAPQVAAAGLLTPLVAAVAALARSREEEVLQAAVKAAGRLVEAELPPPAPEDSSESAEEAAAAAAAAAARPAPPSLAPLVSVYVSALGPDRDVEVQRAALASLRRLGGRRGGAPALAPHFGDLVPPVLAIAGRAAGTSKLSAERALARMMGLEAQPALAQKFIVGAAAGPALRAALTESYQRRLARLPQEDATLDGMDV
jgi:hypothetical protein